MSCKASNYPDTLAPSRVSPLTKWANHRGPTLIAEDYAVRSYRGIVRFDTWQMANPQDGGTFKFVAFGTYLSGRRKGEMAVGKWLKRTPSSCRNFYDSNGMYGFALCRSLKEDVYLAQRALPIVAAFNKTVCREHAYEKKILLTIPDVWEIKNSLHEHLLNTEIIIEPFIEAYTKFNSNTGWCDNKTEDARLMQALSHFSYHYTEGNVLLCDLQGGFEKSSIILTDPALMSHTMEYGPCDMGTDAIFKFFDRHTCNKYCSPDWITPYTECKHKKH